MNKDPRKNAEGYSDPTAFEAIENVSRETKDYRTKEFERFLKIIFALGDLTGFHIENRLIVKDKLNDKIYK